MNTAVRTVVTQARIALNKFFDRLRQIWMRSFVIKLNGREIAGCLRVNGDLCLGHARDLECDDQSARRIIDELKVRGFSI